MNTESHNTCNTGVATSHISPSDAQLKNQHASMILVSVDFGKREVKISSSNPLIFGIFIGVIFALMGVVLYLLSKEI